MGCLYAPVRGVFSSVNNDMLLVCVCVCMCCCDVDFSIRHCRCLYVWKWTGGRWLVWVSKEHERGGETDHRAEQRPAAAAVIRSSFGVITMAVEGGKKGPRVPEGEESSWERCTYSILEPNQQAKRGMGLKLWRTHTMDRDMLRTCFGSRSSPLALHSRSTSPSLHHELSSGSASWGSGFMIPRSPPCISNSRQSQAFPSSKVPLM